MVLSNPKVSKRRIYSGEYIGDGSADRVLATGFKVAFAAIYNKDSVTNNTKATMLPGFTMMFSDFNTNYIGRLAIHATSGISLQIGATTAANGLNTSGEHYAIYAIEA